MPRPMMARPADAGRGALLRRLLPWCLPALVLLFWGLICASGRVPPWLLPSPTDVLRTMSGYLGLSGGDSWCGQFWPDAAASLIRVGCGYGLAVATALPLGLLAGRSARVASLLSVSVNGIKAVPGISWLPLAILWLGIGFVTTMALIALAAFFPIYFSSMSGAASVPPALVASGRMLGLSRAAIFRRIVLPWAMPQITAGLRVALGFAFAYLVLGELTGVSRGVGACIMDARMNGQVDLLICGIVLIACLGAACDWLLRGLVRFLPGQVR